MQPVLITAKTLPEIWFQCINNLLQTSDDTEDDYTRLRPGTHIYTIDRGSFVGQRRLEFDHVTLQIEHPGSLPLVPDVPTGVPAPTTREYIEGYLPYLMEDSITLNENYTYGMDLKKQIPEVIKMYKEDGYNTHQAYMAVGNPDSIFLRDPQCLRGVDTRIQNGKLHFIVYFRSWDLWAGLPSNLGAIQIMKEYMASEIGVEDGELIASSKGLHLYEYSWEFAKAVLRR